MSLVGKVETDVEIKSPAEKFHEVFSSRPHHVSGYSPSNVHACDLHEGEWGKEGSVICWTYKHDGETKIAKEVVEAIDNAKLSVTLNVIEGDLLKEFKSFKATIQATPKGEGSVVVHWTLEYEKLHDQIIDPHSVLQLAVDMSKDIDSHLSKA
uniref:Bet v I/Major latex protein domain-containing protein n=1 Tax=Rhizophora mucronata TaxID=61149 RepID=A0A2P2N522_RHIMU